MIKNRNGLFYYEIIKRMNYLENKQIKLDKEFTKIYNNLMELYKDYPF